MPSWFAIIEGVAKGFMIIGTVVVGFVLLVKAATKLLGE